MHVPKTYVIQVRTGSEARTQRLIERMADPGIIQEVFTPAWDKHMTLGGGRSRIQRVLLTPGYLYVTTPDPDEAARELKRVPAFTKLLGDEARFVPLTDAELVWVNQLTRPGERTVAMSRAVKEGDRVRIVDGPLLGCEAQIVKVNAHKRLAFVELPFMGRMVTVKVGIEVVRGTEGKE